MAGLIAGHDSTLTAPYREAPASAYRGHGARRADRLAQGRDRRRRRGRQPGDRGDRLGRPARQRPGLNIRVINLSYGTNSTQTYELDPLSYAVEQAWKKGIVVVAAAGNTGYQRRQRAPGLADPAYNPYVIGVGGYRHDGHRGDRRRHVGDYSASSAGCGATCKNPDFVASARTCRACALPN